MTRPPFHLPMAAALGLGLLAFPLSARPRAREIRVHNVEELYRAVDGACGASPGCHTTIRMAPGTYVLTAQRPGGGLRSHQGSLRLPPGVSLVGSEQHVDTDGDGVLDPVDPADPDVFYLPGTETLIDGSGLSLGPEERADCTGDARAVFPDPVIYVGYGNTLASLSVAGGGNIAIGEPTREPVNATGSLSIQITDSVIQADVLVISFANSECSARRARSSLVLAHSVVRGGGGGGLGLANFYTGDASNDPSDGPEIVATVAFNLFYNNGTALRAAAGDEGTDGGRLSLHMVGNVFRSNQTNLQGRGCVGRLELPTVGDRLGIQSESDTFGEAPTNILLTAGAHLTLAPPQNCEIEAEFLNSRFIRDSGETPPEISIIGGADEGGGNHARVRISLAAVETSEGLPVEGGLSIEDDTGAGDVSNSARLLGTRQEFILGNQGLPAPPEHFFLGH